MTNERESAIEVSMTCLLLALALFVALVGGCAHFAPRPLVIKPGQHEAVALIWKTYGRTDTPPEVWWAEGDDLTCIDERSGNPGFMAIVLDRGEACVGGVTLTPGRVKVAWRPGVKFHETALAHEMRHAADMREWIADPGHVTEAWQPESECTTGRAGSVARANRLLMEMDAKGAK